MLITVGEREKRKNIPSDYVWVHPSMQLAAADSSKGSEAVATSTGLQTEKVPTKGSIFSRLGNPVGGAGKEAHSSSLKLQPESMPKYFPRTRQVSK